jgi:hypothetical protein
MRRETASSFAFAPVFFHRAPCTASFIIVAELGSGAARKTRDIFWKFREAAYTWRKSAKQALEIACGLRKTCQMTKQKKPIARASAGRSCTHGRAVEGEII